MTVQVCHERGRKLQVVAGVIVYMSLCGRFDDSGGGGRGSGCSGGSSSGGGG